MTGPAFIGGFIQGRMSGNEHTAIYRALSESVVAEPPPSQPGLNERVLRGCELLDKDFPGWADKINLDVFELRDSTNCVIGQVFGDYDEIHQVLDTDEYGDTSRADEDAHGFNLYADGMDPVWDKLDADWKIAIAARQTR